jgi:hypothetical protein
MSDMENTGYQKKVVEKEIKDLTSFLEDVQWKRGTNKKFDPYFRNKNKKVKGLNDLLLTLEDEGSLEVSDDIESQPNEDMKDNTKEGIFIGPRQRYFMGASEDPQMVIVSSISDGKVNYYSPPYSDEETLNKNIAADLFITGCETWLKNGNTTADPELKKSIEAVLAGRPGEKVSIQDYKYSNIQVRYTGTKEGDGGPWKELEQVYGVKVDSVLANKQTYNIRINNKDLTEFENKLNESPAEKRNFEITKIVKEDIDIILEAKSEEKPFAIAPSEREFYSEILQKNISGNYSAEGRIAGERVIYKKEEWVIFDFVGVDDKIKIMLIKPDLSMVANLIDPNKVKDITPEDIEKMNEKEAKESEKEVKKIEKEQELLFPISKEDGSTKKQKALKEEFDDEIKKNSSDEDRKIKELLLFIDNDPDIYKKRLKGVIDNLKSYVDDGSYDSEKAIISFKDIVDDGSKKYFDDLDGSIFGKRFNSWEEMFPEDLRSKTAEMFEKRFKQENIKESSNLEEAVDIESDAVEFTEKERDVMNRDDINVDLDNANSVEYTWKRGSMDHKVIINKIKRKKSGDYMYTSEGYIGRSQERLDKERTLNSEPFESEDNTSELSDFLVLLKIGE